MHVKKISDVIGSEVYTDLGDYFGQVEEANLHENKIDGWKIGVRGGVTSLVGGARGVIIPHQFVKAIGDIFIINRSVLPSPGSEPEEEITEELA